MPLQDAEKANINTLNPGCAPLGADVQKFNETVSGSHRSKFSKCHAILTVLEGQPN